ncbi:Purine permease 1 [Apostasia shenzhenica]|uniref:Probable purine permease n=1 Tax=Apostasia shenzhenica TaxID=1088818 RepID=A0A2I0A3A0_9ASPA|nr:Purine permease 1 [Apostasia shenzhenica]
MTPDQPMGRRRLCFLSLNLFFLIIGCGGMPLLLRLYFVHGGRLQWFSAFLQTAAFPLLLPPLLISAAGGPKFFSLSTSLLFYCFLLGLLSGLVNLFYAYGLSYLPVSTSSLVLSTQLGFTAVFAFLIVKQKFTPYTVNAVVLLTIGAVIIGLHSGGNGATKSAAPRAKHYYAGFGMTIGTAVLDGLLPTLAELMFLKASERPSYAVVMEIQLVMGFSATVFCAVGMAVNKDFQSISEEAKGFGLGESQYYLVIVSFAVVMQCFFLGRVGVVLYSSALLTGIIVDVLLPVTVVLAVIFFDEPFNSSKAIALALALWGFASYIYGETKKAKKEKAPSAKELDEILTISDLNVASN